MRKKFKNKTYTSKKLQKLHDDFVEYLEGQNGKKEELVDSKVPFYCYLIPVILVVFGIFIIIITTSKL